MNNIEWGDYVSCPVCLEEYDTGEREPKNLACGHSGCKKCLQQMIGNCSDSAAENGQNLTCPVCREFTPVPSSVDDLMTNLSLKSIASSYLGKEHLEKSGSDLLSKVDDDEQPTTSGGNGVPKAAILCATQGCRRSLSPTTDGSDWAESDFWVCVDCENEAFCSTCVCQSHAAHSTQTYPEFFTKHVEKLVSVSEKMRECQTWSEKHEDADTKLSTFLAQLRSIVDDLDKLLTQSIAKLPSFAIAKGNLTKFSAIRIDVEQFLDGLTKNEDETGPPAALNRRLSKLVSLISQVASFQTECGQSFFAWAKTIESLESTIASELDAFLEVVGSIRKSLAHICETEDGDLASAKPDGNTASSSPSSVNTVVEGKHTKVTAAARGGGFGGRRGGFGSDDHRFRNWGFGDESLHSGLGPSRERIAREYLESRDRPCNGRGGFGGGHNARGPFGGRSFDDDDREFGGSRDVRQASRGGLGQRRGGGGFS